MNSRSLRGLAELALRIRLYRERTLPWGVDFAHDAAIGVPDVRITTIFDVGANVGQSAIAFARRFPVAHVWSFEPFAETFRELERNTASLPRVRCYQLALGAAAERVSVVPRERSVNNSLRNAVFPDEGVGEIVDVKTLDAFADEHDVTRIDFLKVDTEGWDLEVLKGAEELLARRAVTFVEVECGMGSHNTKHIPFTVLASHLEGRGYALFGFYDQRPERSVETRLRWTNAVFVVDRSERS